jgi:serralysin
MTTFRFETITPAEALNIQSQDIVLFAGGSANAVSVFFDTSAGTPAPVTIAFGGRTLAFGQNILAVSSHDGLQFSDSSELQIGGSGADVLVTRELDDALFGGPGDDSLLGHGGNNVVQGNAGNDHILTDEGSDTIFGGQGDDIIITGVGGTLATEGIDFAQGNKGDDSIGGGAGADTLLGGQGNDLILGGAGNDYLSGDRGDDRLDGGAGADIFHAVDDGGTDQVDDFNLAEGDRVQLDPGTAFQVTQVGEDTVVTLAGDGRMVLLGVDMTTLHGDWIFGS